MMKQRCLCSTVLIATVFCLAVVDRGPAAERESGPWTDLFNSRDLTGWDVLTCEAVVQDGVLLLKGGNGLVQTKEQYANFVLHFECQGLKPDKWDSGVYFRYTSVPEGKPWPPRYQVNLRKGLEGNLVGSQQGTSTGLFKPGEWNQFEMTVRGESIALKINDQAAWKADGIKVPQGYISLQAEIPGGGQFLFRNVKIKVLP